MQHLQSNSLLQGGRYKIVKSLGQGGFGVTYLGIQSGLERKVAIKEFFMKELCERDESTSHVTLGTEGSRETVNRFREKFLKEARNIAKLNHPNIVRIIDVFEENGTAYYVMEYAENGSLADKVKREGYLTEPVATRYIIQIAEALDYIHQQKMNHLDVKPANIMLNEKDEAVLIDFGLSKQYDAVTGNQTSTTPVGISHGYAPMEQYKEGGVQDFTPETDIYALGATFFKLLTGITPPSATDIMEDGLSVQDLKAKGVSTEAIAAICKAMEPRKRDRIRNVRMFIEGLKVVTNGASESNSLEVENEAAMFISKPQEGNMRNNTRRKSRDNNRSQSYRRNSQYAQSEETVLISDNQYALEETIVAGNPAMRNVFEEKVFSEAKAIIDSYPMAFKEWRTAKRISKGTVLKDINCSLQLIDDSNYLQAREKELEDKRVGEISAEAAEIAKKYNLGFFKWCQTQGGNVSLTNIDTCKRIVRDKQAIIKEDSKQKVEEIASSYTSSSEESTSTKDDSSNTGWWIGAATVLLTMLLRQCC